MLLRTEASSVTEAALEGWGRGSGPCGRGGYPATQGNGVSSVWNHRRWTPIQTLHGDFQLSAFEVHGARSLVKSSEPSGTVPADLGSSPAQSSLNLKIESPEQLWFGGGGGGGGGVRVCACVCVFGGIGYRVPALNQRSPVSLT